MFYDYLCNCIRAERELTPEWYGKHESQYSSIVSNIDPPPTQGLRAGQLLPSFNAWIPRVCHFPGNRDK